LRVLALAAPALATPPQTGSFSGTDSGVINCAGFDDNFTDVFSAQATVFFDNAGEPDPCHKTCRVSLDRHELGDTTHHAA
jgi:hypothetical protein